MATEVRGAAAGGATTRAVAKRAAGRNRISPMLTPYNLCNTVYRRCLVLFSRWNGVRLPRVRRVGPQRGPECVRP